MQQKRNFSIDATVVKVERKVHTQTRKVSFLLIFVSPFLLSTGPFLRMEKGDGKEKENETMILTRQNEVIL